MAHAPVLAQLTGTEAFLGAVGGLLTILLAAILPWTLSLYNSRQAAKLKAEEQAAKLANERKEVEAKAEALAAERVRTTRADVLRERENYTQTLLAEIKRVQEESAGRGARLDKELAGRDEKLESLRKELVEALTRIAHLEAENRYLHVDIRKLQARHGDASPGTILPVVITATADDGVIRDVGPQVAPMFHWTRAELVGKPVEVLIPERYRESYRKGMARAAANGYEIDQSKIPIRGHAIQREGVEFPVLVFLTSFVSPSSGKTFVNAEIRIDYFPTESEVETHGPTEEERREEGAVE